MKADDALWKTVLGALLIGGTALGAGMLALPIATAGGGLIPSWVMYALCWGFSIATGLLFVEIALWLPQNANIVSMAHRILGPPGKVVAWILYIFLFYCLTIAYVAEGGKIIASLLSFPNWLSSIIFTLFFGSFIYAGTKAAGRLNSVLMVGLIVSFLLFILVASQKVEVNFFGGWNWGPAFLGLPIIFTSFSYQGTIPTLFAYLNRDPKKIRAAIIYGLSIPFVSYLIWDWIISGIIPPSGLLKAKAHGLSAIAPLQEHLSGTNIANIGNFFAFFALTTSFIGVTLGLLDFLSDSLQVKKTPAKKLSLCSLIFIPPIFISIINPNIFLSALSFAGGFGCAILLGLLPTIMVWKGRYHMDYPSLCQQLPGGRLTLSLLILFVALELFIELVNL